MWSTLPAALSLATITLRADRREDGWRNALRWPTGGLLAQFRNFEPKLEA
jgi:hypothetical protein